MAVPLDLNQQKRVYNYYHNHFNPIWKGIKQPQMDEPMQRSQIDDLRDKLQQRMNEVDLQGLHLQEAMIDYLLIREHEEALRLPQTSVPVILLPYFQNISHSDLQAVVNRLAVFPTSAITVNSPQPRHVATRAAPSIATSQEATYQILVDRYNAVRARRITRPESIRELARRFLEMENDPDFPYDAGKVARILLQRARSYEDRAGTGNI
jgi:hypothetical protein